MRRPLSIMRVDARQAGSRSSTSRSPARGTVAAADWRDHQRAGSDRSRLRRASRTSPHALVAWRRHPAHGVFGGIAEDAPCRSALAAARADGVRDRVSVPRSSVQILVPGVPNEAIACMRCSTTGHCEPARQLQRVPGCFHGYVTDLAAHWLASLDAQALARSKCSRAAQLQCCRHGARGAQIRVRARCRSRVHGLRGRGCAGCAVPVVQLMRARDEARVRRWTCFMRMRCFRRCLLSTVAPLWSPRETRSSGCWRPIRLVLPGAERQTRSRQDQPDRTLDTPRLSGFSRKPENLARRK